MKVKPTKDKFLNKSDEGKKHYRAWENGTSTETWENKGKTGN